METGGVFGSLSSTWFLDLRTPAPRVSASVNRQSEPVVMTTALPATLLTAIFDANTH